MTQKSVHRSLLFLTILLFLSSLTAWSISKKRVALFQINAVNTSEVYAQKMFWELQSTLTTSKKLSLASEKKEELTKKIEEMKKTGCTEAECLTNAGVELDVEKVLSGELRQMPEGYFELDLRMVDVLSGEYEYAYETIKGEKAADFRKMAGMAVDMIDSKIIIEPTIQNVVGDGTVVIDAGGDLGMKKGMRFSVIRIKGVQKDGKGKIIFRDEENVGEIELSVIQALGSRAKVISELQPLEVGDIAHVTVVVDQIDEPPKIIHSPLKATVQGKDILIQANVIDDKKVESAVLWFRNAGEEKMRTLSMTNPEKDKYVATIPASSIAGTSVEYYIAATDSKRQVTEKRDDSKKPFSVMVIPDNEPPTLEHTAIAEVNSFDRIEIRTVAKDNVKVSKVLVFYKKRENQKYQSQEMTWQGGNAYAVLLPENSTVDTRSVQYYITAFDQAGNTRILGEIANPYEIKIITKDLQGPQIAHSPVKTFESGTPVTIEAQITDPSGVRRAVVYVKPDYETQFRAFEMTRLDAKMFRVQLDKSLSQIGSSRLNYYIWAEDELGNDQSFGNGEAPNIILPKMVESSVVAKSRIDKNAPYASHFPAVIVRKGLGYVMMVEADDESGIGSVILYERGPSQSGYRQVQLRQFALGWYGDFISNDVSPLSYYIEIKDIYENLTQIGDSSHPIVVVPDEILQGKYRYIMNSRPYIPPVEIGFFAPAELAKLGSFQEINRPRNVEIHPTGNTYHIEGVIQSTRECKYVRIDTVLATLLPLNADELKRIPKTERSVKFACTIPTPVDKAVVRVLASDILGKLTYVNLKIENSSNTLPAVFVEQKKSELPSKISVSDPAVSDNERVVTVVGASGGLYVSGRIVWSKPVQRVMINETKAATNKVDEQTTRFESKVLIADGNNTLTITAWSSSGETLSRTIAVNATNSTAKIVDQIPPEIEITSPHVNQATNTPAIVLRARITDNLKVESVGLSVGGEEKKKVRFKREGDAVVIVEDTLLLKQGKNTVRVVASDGRQTSTKSIEVTYKKSSEPPTIFVISPSGESVTDNSIALNFNVAGFRAGMKVRVAVNNVIVHENLAEGKTIAVDRSKPVEFLCPLRVKSGVNRILITVFYDDLSVQCEKKVSFGLPTLTIIAPTDTAVNQSQIEVRFMTTNIYDDESIIVTVNGRQIEESRGIKIARTEGKPIESSRLVTLQEGMNRIVLLARNETGTATAEMSIRLKESLIPDDRFYALIIGVQAYSDQTIANLDNPIRDAKRLRDVLLDSYTFDQEHTLLLENPDRKKILSTFDKLANTLKESDNLLVFYAGHGYWDEKNEQGYWWPSDAAENSRSQWISNSDIRDAIKSLSAKHVLLIADACFGGSIFKSRGKSNAFAAINKLYEKPSRKAMTSGNLTVTPDESKFLYYLEKSLKENKETYISSEKLFYEFKEAVVANSSTIPQYGTIHEAKDEGGEFIFVKKNH